MKYSFVIPTYNNKDLLNNTLEALNHQLDFEYGAYEAVVVDDGSDDGSREYVRDTPRTYELQYIYLERTDDSCRARVRNEGWRRARGKYVVFLDSDMIVARDYLRELNRYFDRDEDLLVISYRYLLHDPVSIEDVRSGKAFEAPYRSLEYMEARHFDAQQHSFNMSALRFPWHAVYSCNLALSKAKLEEVGGFEERYKGWGMEDTDFGYRCYKRGIQIVSHLGTGALHQYHGEKFGDARSMKKMLEWDRNITLMYRIHPSLKRELPRWRINVAYFIQGVPRMLMRKERGRIEHRLTLRRREELPALKAQIAALSAEPGNLIVVADETDSAEFHLWIQLLGFTKSEIRYFPRTFTFDRKEVCRYFGEVFTWEKKLVIIYRCCMLLANKLVRAVSRLVSPAARNER
ncbi:glycosyltransferase family 2 protein [Paenibacillaceae bacterium WGS1546]|uniref:glycosyltransferase family 2 protein n=1 Tax=Cohnella sp. WGS1546 TaxID=3366810 RepID=UPI00372D075D